MCLLLASMSHFMDYSFSWENFPAKGREEEVDNLITFKSILRKLTYKEPVLGGDAMDIPPRAQQVLRGYIGLGKVDRGIRV